MPTRLYVSNLSRAATLASVRELFGACGDVIGVEFVAERSPREPSSAAYVTMGSDAGADKAITRLQGRLHHERSLMISRAPGNDSVGMKERPRQPASAVGVAIAQQYRDRHGLAYELDCAGLRLTLRFLFPSETEAGWRVEARLGSGSSPIVDAVAPTRKGAFDGLSEAWKRVTTEPPVPELDWGAVAIALQGVKAL